MRFEPLGIDGAFKLVLLPLSDERGFFARTVCEAELQARGLIGQFAQSSISVSTRRGTVRGMHFSVAPYAETKIVRCTAGAIYDVLVDVRVGSPSYLQTESLTLSAENREAVYIPAGVAHGFQTLCDQTEVLYLIDVPYVADCARGLRWNDPAMVVSWPHPITIIADRDLAYLDWTP
jgi:dTDP-4-dehydrorhamnose 3,5-epimerase